MSIFRSRRGGRVLRILRWFGRAVFENIPFTPCREVHGVYRVLRCVLRSAMLVPLLGWLRGGVIDDRLVEAVAWTRARTADGLTTVMVPWLAQGTVELLSFAAVATLLGLWTALVVMRLPSFLGAILVWLIGEQQGNWFTSRVQLVVVISLPFALATSLFCPHLLGIYTLIYFALGATYIDLAIEPRRVNLLLQRYGLAQGVYGRRFSVTQEPLEGEESEDDSESDEER